MADDEKPDERPRPQYGELAPEGWVWRPPADDGRLDTSKPAPLEPAHDQPPAAQADGGTSSRPSTPAAGASGAETPRWNLSLTLILIVLGFLGMTYSIGTLNAFPAAIQAVHAQENLHDYSPAPAVAPLLTAGSIIQVVVWAISTGLSIWLLTRRRISFYVPLVAGAVALIALFIIASLVLTTDSALLDFYGGVTTPTPGITTPGITTPGIATPAPGETP